MLPAGTSRLRPVKAGCPLKDFLSPCAAITPSLMVSSRCLSRAMLRQFVFKQSSYLVSRQPKIGEPIKCGLDGDLGPFGNPCSADTSSAYLRLLLIRSLSPAPAAKLRH